MRCGFINEDDSSFICERCNNNQPFQCEIAAGTEDDGGIPAPPGGEADHDEWDGNGHEDGTDDVWVDEEDNEEGEDEEDGEGEEDGEDEGGEEEWDDTPPEPDDEDVVEPVEPSLPYICPKCKRKIRDHWTSCAYCGTPLRGVSRAKCPSCGKPMNKGWALCAYCGKKC